MDDIFNNKTILVTGGTGSFGRKFVETLVKKYRIKKVIVFSRDEMKQYEMRKSLPSTKIRYFIGDVRDEQRLHRALNHVDIVVHAAALKIIPSTEYNPFEAVKTNVIGAENIINIAIDNNVKKVIALSTDKAANPINLYGATKLCAEKMFIAANNYSAGKTCFSVVRYGNVFGSRGSVVPFFKERKASGVIPITDNRMTRFWITLEQGVEFVIRSLRDMRRGEIFVPKIPSMRITDLAKAIAPDCKFKFVGIRPGEKIHETLVSAEEGRFTVEQRDRFIICPEVVMSKIDRKWGKFLSDQFKGYSSDSNNVWLSQKDLKKLITKGYC